MEDNLGTALDRRRMYKLTLRLTHRAAGIGHQLCLFVLIIKRKKKKPELKETGEKYREKKTHNSILCFPNVSCLWGSKYSLNINSNISSSKVQTGQTLLPSSER